MITQYGPIPTPLPPEAVKSVDKLKKAGVSKLDVGVMGIQGLWDQFAITFWGSVSESSQTDKAAFCEVFDCSVAKAINLQRNDFEQRWHISGIAGLPEINLVDNSVAVKARRLKKPKRYKAPEPRFKSKVHNAYGLKYKDLQVVNYGGVCAVSLKNDGNGEQWVEVVLMNGFKLICEWNSTTQMLFKSGRQSDERSLIHITRPNGESFWNFVDLRRLSEIRNKAKLYLKATNADS